ncbi:hypothetical protein ACFXTO_027466 [Malus domestica]
MGSERSYSTQNDTPIGPSMKQRKQEGNRVTLQAKVDELEAQNNKIVMRNEVLQEQYEKLFEMLHEARHAQAHKLVAPAEVNNHLNAPQHGGHRYPTRISLIGIELHINVIINMRLLSTQLLQPEAEGVEESTSSQKEWKDQKPSIAIVETS